MTASPSPAQWPEDVVEKMSRINDPEWWGLYDGLDCHSNVFERQKTKHLDNMRAALATLPPPEDERVKGLVEVVQLYNIPDLLDELNNRMRSCVDGRDIVPGTYHDASVAADKLRSALASYRGGA